MQELRRQIPFSELLLLSLTSIRRNSTIMLACRPDEAELFAKSAQNAYRQFRDKAAFSRSMPVWVKSTSIISGSHPLPLPLTNKNYWIFYPCFQVDKMEEVAQGRVWTGKDAASRGLVDAIGGFSRAIAIAKQKANIPQDRPVGASSYIQFSPQF